MYSVICQSYNIFNVITIIYSVKIPDIIIMLILNHNVKQLEYIFVQVRVMCITSCVYGIEELVHMVNREFSSDNKIIDFNIR